MKKHLCFVLILCLALSGLYAQSPCVRFDMPNLYPVPGTPQDVDIYFNNAGLGDNTQYAMTYTLLHNGEEIEDVDLATHINTASSYLLIPFYTNNSYSGQFLNSPSSIFPSGTFEAGLNMNNTQFNFFYGKYLKTNSVRIRMHLAWRSDRTYDDDEYTLIVNLVEMQNGTKVNKKYNGTVNIGGIGATPTGVTVTSDTIHTIKRVEDIIYDTICYSQLPYTMPGSRTTITTDTVVKANYIQPSGSAFYSIVNTTMTFGNPLNANQCNERIDSIATVRIYVRPELTLSNASTGHNLTICSYANAGYVSVIPTGGKAPYTVYAYKKSSADTYESVPTSSITITSSGTAGTINGLGVGTYKLVCVDAAGCQPAEETEAIISQVGTDNVYNIATISTTNVFCYGGSNGAINIDVTHTSGDGAGELTYQWTGPNDFSATTQDINNVPAGTYNVTVSDTMGCKATQQYTLDDGTLITTSTNVACCASELPYHYDTNHADTIFYSAGTKEVHYTSFMGCDSVVNVTLTVRDNPTVNWGETPASVCVGATLTATANTGMSDYHWTKDGNATADDDNTAEFLWTAAGAQTISVNFTQTITTDGLTTNCRVVSDTVKEITVNPLPTTTVTVAVNENPKDGTEITVCDGQTVTLTATDGCEYAWKKVGNDATIGTEKNLTLANVTTANAGKYAVVLTNTTTGCTVHSDTVTLTVNAPAVTITTPMADATICEGTTTTTYNLSIEATAGTGSTLSYAWTNNKSATFSDATVANPTATLTDTTTFYVDVTATIGACSVHAYDTVIVNVNAPKVTLNAIATTNPNDTILCASSTGTTLTISTAESKGTVVYTWFNQSNNESVNITPSDIEDNYREFSVSAVATIGTCTKEDTKSIKVYVLRPAVTDLTITPSSATICKNSDITLTASATETEHVSYVWTNDVNTDTYTGAAYIVTPTANTTFTVTCTDTVSKDAVVCTKQDTKTVEVTVLAPAVTINKVNDTTICYGQTVTLPTSAIVATSNGTLSYNWNDGTNNLAVYDVTPEATTTYYLTVTNTVSANSVDCPAYAYDTVVVNVNRPFVTLGKMDDVTICYEGSTTLTAIVTDKASNRLGYQWKSSKLDGSNMETLSQTTASIDVTPTDTTVYYLTVIDTVGSCTAVAYDTVIVNVNHPQVTANNITVTPAANPICVGSSTKLTASVDGTYGIISYKWNDDVTVADTTVAPAATATFTVTVTATIGECSVSATKGFEVVVNDTVQLTATPTKQSVCPGSEVTFSHSVTSGTLSESTSELPTGLIYSNTAGTITGAPTTAGTYYITVTATSNQAANCPAKSVIDTLIVNSTVAFTASDTTQSVCPGTAITNVAFTVENGTLPASISGLPAGLTYNQADKRISGTPTQVGIFHYSVTATSDQTPACDSKTITGTITVYDTATLTVTGTTEQALCLGEKLSTIKFAKTNGVYNLETAGTLPAGVTFVGDSISGTPTESGTFTYTITVVSDHNCSNYNKQKTVTIQIKDTVELTLASSSADKDQEFCLGSSLENITMDSANCTLAISWDNTPAGVTFAHGVISGTPTGTGNTYNYTVTATSNNGCTSTDKTLSGTITVNDTVELAFHAGTTGDRTVCLGDAIEDIVIDTANCNPVTITGLPAGLSYADGKIIGRPTASGDYTIAATNAKNCHNKTISGTITVNDTVVLKFHEGNGDRIVCQGAAIEDIVIDTANCNPVTITGLSAGLSYANGKITGTPTATGSYTIAASNGNNCRNKTITGTITVNDTVVPTISANNNTICVSASETHDTVTLSTNITEAGYTFAWTLDGGEAIASTSTASETVKAQWTTAGTKTIGVAITNSTTNCVSRANANIVVNDVTTFTVAHTASLQSGEYRICAYDKDTLTPSVESGINYTWTPNEHLTVYNSYKQIFAYDRAGKYTYTVSGLVTETGCQTSQTVSIIVDSVPTVTITPTDVTCFGANNGSLVANVTGGTASYCYRWSDNNVNVCGQPATHSRGNIQGETLQPTAYPATYSVTVMDIHGCTATASAEIKEPSALTVTKTQHVNVACFNGNNGILAYEATGGKPTASGNYNFKFNRNEAESATSKIYSGLSASIDTIKVTDANGCSVTLYDTIIQPEEFHVSISGITGNRDSICADGTANYKSVLTAAQDGYTYQYQWYKNDVILTDSTRDEITNLSNPAGEYEYKVIVTQQTTSAPCTQKDSVVLTVLAMPTTAITVLNDTICFGTSATLTANGAQAYQWKLNGTDKGTASTLAIEQAAGSEEYFRHTYELTGTNTYGTKNCVVTDDTVIIINNPYVTLTPMEDKTICNETEQTLTATIATNANDRLGYDWKSSKLDGSNMVALTEHTASINVAPTDTTVYYLTVTDTVGNCTAMAYDTVVVKVNGPAVTLADITYAPNDTVCLGESVTLTASYETLKGEISYKWSDNGANRADTTVTPGIGSHEYTVTATATIGTCSVTATKMAKVVVNDTVKLAYVSGPKDTTICKGQLIPNIVYSVENGTMSILWPESGSQGLSFNAETGTISGTPTATVTYTIKATSNKNPQCSEKTITHTITVNDTANFTITAKHGEFCADASDTLTVTEGYTYEWGVPTGLTRTDGDNQYKKAFTGTPTTNTTYTITVTASTAANCKTTKTKEITVDSLPRPTITIPSDAKICLSASETNNTLLLTTQANYSNYAWNFGTDGATTDSDNDATMNAQWTTAGGKTVTVTVTNSKNCAGTGTTTITVKDTTTFAFASKDGDFEICMGMSDTVTATPADLTYTWPTATELGGTANNVRGFTSNTKGVYNYNVAGINAEGCQLTKTVTLTVDTVPAVTLTPTDVLCYGGHTGKMEAAVTGGNSFTYAWTNSAHETVSDVTALPVGRYYVTVTNDHGCTATANDTIMQPDTLTIEVTALTNISCSYSGNMGSITVLAQGGKTTVEKPYTYKFNEEDYLNRIPTWTGLNNGNYTITVKDANGCTASVDTVIKRPEVLTITHDSINPSCFGSTNGRIIAHVTGGNEGTISYTWSNNGSVNDTLNGIGAGKYTLQVNDVKGCVAHDTIVLTQPEEFHVVLSGEDSICAGGTTTFTATLTPTASYTYKWYKDNTLMESETGTSITTTEAGKYIVVASQGTTNCEQSDTVTLTVLSNPVLTITVTPNDTICLDGTATISVATADAYAWKQNGIDAGSDDLVNVPQTVGTYCYEVTGTNTYGTKTCSTTAKDTVVVLPLPSATLTVNNEPKAADCDVTVCALNSLVISVPDQSGVTYKWYKGNTEMDSTRHELNFAAITAENAGEYKVTVTNSTTQCDSTSYKVNVTVNPLPSATISVNGEVKTANAEVAVCNSGSLVISVPEQSGATYKWFKDNAQMDSTRHELNFATVAATDAATYYAKVTGANTCDSTSYTVKVTVDTLPAVTITALDSICLSASERFDTLTLSAPTGASYTYEWALDGGEAVDGTTTSSATVKAQWSSVSGTKTVSVTITNGKGCKNTEEKEITAFDINDFTITADHERFCADAYDTLTVSDGNNYEWVCPTGLTMTDGDNDFKKSFKAANNSRTTDFTITVKGTTDKGCLITKTKEIKVDSLPNVTVNDPSVCRNSSVTLEAAGATTYAWAPADSLNASTGTSVNFKSATAGTFPIVVTGTNGQGCSATDTATITVNDLPGSGALASLGTEKFCKGGVKGFKVSGYNDYVWTSTPADGSLTFLGDSATFTGNTPGSYVVLVEVTDANGCKSSTSANVTVDTLPVPTITANANVCVNGELEFTTENTDVQDYVWTFTGTKVDSTGSTLQLKWGETGTKTVTVNYTDNNGCTAVTPASKEITVHALPVVEITEGRDSTICRGSSITLHATSDQTETAFGWDNNVGSDVAQVTVTPVTDDSTFVVTGTYWPVAGALSCASTDTITVHLQDTVKLTVENATQTKCLGQAIDNITVNYEAANLSWNPTSFTEGLTSTESANTVTLSGNITHAGTYTYVVTATSTNNCGTKEATITLTVNDTNKLSSASTLTQTICLGTDIDGIVLDTANCTLSFSPELSTKGLSYNATTATISGTPSVAENFTVTITATPATDGCNAAKTLAFTITVLDTNKLEFVDPATATQEICLGEPIADIVLDTANCTLDLSQVTAINGLSYNAASHKIEGTPITAGTYTATITATATNQVDAATPCNAVITRNITIKVNDTVKIAATEGDNLTRKLCKGNAIDEVKLWATNGTIALGSGSIPTDLSTSYPTSANDTIKLNGTMATAGTYEFFVVATGTACTTSKDSLKVTITVDTIPFVAITPNVDTVCPNADLRTATLTATAGYVTYAWSCSTENANTVTVTPEDSQNIYTVTVTNGQNCTATANDTIRLYTLSVSTISGDNKICLGESTTLTAAPDANHTAASYEWIGIAGANTNEITVKPVADSIFRVRVVDNHGCYDTAKITITVDTLPNASITASATTVCQDGTVELTANNNSGDLTYLWKDGADSVFNARVFNFVTDTNTTANIHKISVQITDGEGCVNSDTASVTVKLVPILSETHNRVRCYGESTAAIDLNVRYKENIVVDETYAWTKEGDASFSRTTEDINGLAKGTYNVTVSDGNCSAEMSVTIEQPDTLTLTFAHTVSQLCSGTDSLTVVPVGGNGGFHYVWTTDGTDDAVTTDSILRISNLTAGTHTYTVTVTDDSNCVAYTPTAVEVTSERIEVQREITLGPGETYSYGGYTYGLSPEDEGKTFEVSSGSMGTGNCDSVFIYTIHMYGIGMNFTDGSYTIRHSGYFNNYLFTPSVSFDTIQTSVEMENEFYAYVNCGSDSIDDKRIDMKYEILFNDAEIPTSDFTDYITDMRMMSYYDHDRNFYGIPHIDSARGEMPGTTFLYQYPSNSTAYYYDYFNFGAFRNMPQKIQFTLMKEGTYTFKFTVEERVESTGGQTWGFYNPYVVNGAYGPIWGGRGDTYTGKKTISSRVMTVIVGETGSTSSTPIITSIDNYANNTVPTVTTFPNPARDLLNLNISGMEGNTRITITDATGKLVRVYDEHLLGNDATLTYDIANFSQGIYFINVYNNETILTNKFIVTK